ncbi:MAG TPA: sulfurtransferase [Thiotrichaceae bacterium]|jgi:thiosulfate/3-mercaptopyruvate sulfurtransferase|nr:sulfurtransferase [Thiotrichaceae bacterium]HIM08634.1 sulfurtransferase [Gammaproteobacteria bacterium]
MFTTLIDFDSLHDAYENPDWLIFDTRYDLADKDAGKRAYLQEHIPSAIYVDLHDDLSRPPATNKGRHPLPSVETMNVLFSELGIHSGSQVIIYDNSSGAFAARLWWMLRHMQHEAVAVLDGGWQAWLAASGPTDSNNEIRSESTFNNQAIKQDVIDIDQVQNFDLIIDSREPVRYRGESEPMDKAAGHIPGAINRFWKDNLLENGQFKEKSLLIEEFEKMLGNTQSEEAVFYCGSGVTACHNLLAAAYAGLDLPKLYAGSWSEWSSNPENPVATGH